MNYRTLVLGSLTLAFLVTSVGRLIFSPLVPFIVDDFGISNTAIGLSLTGMWFAFALAQFPSGVLAEKYGGKRIVLVSVGGTGLLCVAIWLTPIFPLFAAGVFLVGVTTGLHYSVATTMLSRLYDGTGRALGIHAIGAPIAGLLTPVAGTWLAITFDWRLAVLVAAAGTLPVFALVARRIRRREPSHPERPLRERVRPAYVRELLTRPSISFTLVVAAVLTFVVQGLYSFVPTFLVQFRDQDPALASVLFSAFFVVTIPGQIGLGKVSDAYGRDRTVAGSILVAGAGMALLLAGPHLLSAFAGVVLLALGTHCLPVVQARFYDHLSTAEQSSGFGLVRTTYMIVASLGSVTVGVLADLYGWGASFAALGCLLAAVFLALAGNLLAGNRY
jgi:predicted MFS family arabinose efflux permease